MSEELYKTVIITNNHKRELLRWHDLTKKEQNELDYEDTEQGQLNFTGFRYNGYVYDLAEFVYTGENHWHGVKHETATSGLLVHLYDDYEENIIVARFYHKSTNI